MTDEILDDELRQRIFLALNNVAKSMHELKEDTIIRLLRAENKITELEGKVKELEHEIKEVDRKRRGVPLIGPG